jgi:hypothetical protein
VAVTISWAHARPAKKIKARQSKKGTVFPVDLFMIIKIPYRYNGKNSRGYFVIL